MLYLPNNYNPKLGLRETQRAIKVIKDSFQRELSTRLNLDRVTAPIIVKEGSGLNDDLSGVERKVSFTIKELNENSAEVVQSLAKWKRMALYKYRYEPGEGIYTDMNALRRDDSLDSTHSIFVDQWDWERIITRDERNESFLRSTVVKIVDAIVDVKEMMADRFPCLTNKLSREVHFVTTQELEDAYPSLTPKERENAIVKEYKTVFIMKIGEKLTSGEIHDTRAPDYDDWSLNGDLMFWDDTLGIALEISSMGIRVDAKALEYQLKEANKEERKKYQYHSMILSDELPLTIGGGIGQSRLCMLMLEKAHVGEVQVSVWPDEMLEICEKHGIFML